MLKIVKPTTPGRRQLIQVKKKGLGLAKKPFKKLLQIKNRSSGRNNQGHLTSLHRGGGHKKRYRIIDFRRDKEGVPGIVRSIEYDPNRTAYIALIHYQDGAKMYILAPRGLKKGDKILAGKGAPLKNGNALSLKDISVGFNVHNIELRPGRGGQLVRSAGLSAQIMSKKDDGYVTLKMPSGEIRRIPSACKATVGIVSNPERNLRMLGKAGRSRWLGKRPVVRAIHKNPVDHPMGGGEGKGKGNIPRSATSVLSKGFKTRSRKNKWVVGHRKSRK